MAGRTGNFGKYGARGIPGGEAIGRQLDRLATFFATPITQQRGLFARLRYLTANKTRLAAARAAGLTATDRTIRLWLRGERKPSKANLQRIEDSYRRVRRQNVARNLQKRLEADGGTRVEIHPVNQSKVDRRHHRHIEYRRLNIRHWGPFVQAWAAGSTSQLQNAWIDAIQDLGSQWGEYEYVSNVGFAA